MVVQRVEVVDQLLIILHRDVRLRLLDVLHLTLVAGHLFLNLFDHPLVILDLELDVFVCDALCRVLISFLLCCRETLLLHLVGDPLLDEV